MNDFQKNILNMELYYEKTAIGNIGGLLDLDMEIGYETADSIIASLIKNTAGFRCMLSKDGKIYEGNCESFADPEGHFLKHLVLDVDKEEYIRLANKWMGIPFESIYDNPLIDLTFVEYKGGRGIFAKLHHIIGDARVVQILSQSFGRAYKSLIETGGFEFPYEPVYKPCLSDSVRERAKDYFRKQLEGLKDEDHFLADRVDVKAGMKTFTPPLYDKDMAAAFVAAAYIYFSRISAKDKYIFGFVLANRRKSELDKVGMYANTLPLVLKPCGEDINALIKSIKSEIFSLMRYSGYSSEMLKEDLDIRGNIFDVSISYRYGGFLPDSDIGETIECFNGCVDVPIRFNIEERKGELEINIIYRKSMFEEAYIENMGSSICTVLNQIMLENRAIEEIDTLTDYDRKVYGRLNDTAHRLEYKDITECFYKHIKDETALIWDEDSITGLELAKRSEKLASYFVEFEVKRIGIRMKRSHEMIESVTGALLAGSAFMIISDSYGKAEKYCDYILDQDRYDSILYTEANGDLKTFDISYDPQSTAYMILTSGSTGEPKCIEISRSSLLSRLYWAHETWGLDSRILQKTVNTFDVSIWEMLSVFFGAELYLLPHDSEKRPDIIASDIKKWSIEKLHFVPSMLGGFLRYIKETSITFPSLKEIFVSGEKLESYMVKEFYGILPDVRLINLYGPAECTIDVTCYECDKDLIPNDIPIGRPLYNTEIGIYQGDRLMPVGVSGEICIFGELVGKGYVNDRLDSGFCTLDGRYAYRTGDIGSIGFDGLIHIVGRADRQIKLRGMRIDISGVKAAIAKTPGVDDIEILEDKGRLIGFYKGEANPDDIKGFVENKLFSYAIPSILIRLSELPLGSSGKTDIKALHKLWEEKREVYLGEKKRNSEALEHLDALEKTLLKAVGRYIDVTCDEDVFDAGLDSISVIDVVCTLREQGIDITFGDFYDNRTVRRIAKNIDKKNIYTFLSNRGAKRLLVCFPYAGGEPSDFELLAKDISHLPDTDVAGVYTSLFEDTTSVNELAKAVYDEPNFRRYEEIYVLGQCVGAMPAYIYASLLGERAKGLILVAPSLNFDNAFIKGSPWKHLPDSFLKFVLRLAGGKTNYTRREIEEFRRDTDRYFMGGDMREFKLSSDCKVRVIFGGRDLFTVGKRGIIRKIKKQLKNDVKVYNVSKGKHFINRTDHKKIAAVIKSLLEIE